MELAVPEVGAAVFEDAPLLVASLGRVADEEAVGLGLAEETPPWWASQTATSARA
ncbi:hypothetical protein ACFQ0M_48205 [Kitasatospora aburaviensis]